MEIYIIDKKSLISLVNNIKNKLNTVLHLLETHKQKQNNIDKIKYFLIIGKKKIKDIKYKAVRKIDVLSPDR